MNFFLSCQILSHKFPFLVADKSVQVKNTKLMNFCGFSKVLSSKKNNLTLALKVSLI